jgi:hypothetical protein
MGKMSDSEMFDGSCVFIDSVTGFIHLVLQVNLNTHETLNAIHEFEQVCRDHGVVPQLYHSDNASVFTSEGMAERLKRFAQIIMFAGAGAHHHNGMAEHAIGTIPNMARTMMLHAAIHWPDATNATQWPMAVKHTTYFLQSHATSGNWNFPWIFSRKRDGSRRNFTIVMSGDAQCMCWTRLSAMERKSQSGSHDLSEPSTWGTHQSIRAQCHLS